VMRPEDDWATPPETIKDWGAERAADRGIDLANIL